MIETIDKVEIQDFGLVRQPSEFIPADTAVSVAIAGLRNTYQTLWDPTQPTAIRNYLATEKLPSETKQVILSIEIEDDSTKDGLTGLWNKKSFPNRFEEMLERAYRNSTAMAVVAIDLDGFKAVNDTYGHKAGDEVLAQVADRMKNSIRSYDSVHRMGGDEFVILLDDIKREDLETKTDELSRDIIHPVTLSNGESVKVGASMGLVDLSMDNIEDLYLKDKPTRQSELTDILSVADYLMYKDKKDRKAGR